MRYNLHKTEKDSYFIECVKNDIYTYHRTDAEKNIEEAVETFLKCDSYTCDGFEECSDSNCTREKYHLSSEIIFAFDCVDDLIQFIKDYNHE